MMSFLNKKTPTSAISSGFVHELESASGISNNLFTGVSIILGQIAFAVMFEFFKLSC